MRLVSGDGACVDLRVAGYQFPVVSSGANWDREWDPNWLVIEGGVRPLDHAPWTFRDPCMTTWEAAQLGVWLHRVADGLVDPHPDSRDPFPRQAFLEPNVAFACSGTSGPLIALNVEFSYGSGPPDEFVPAWEWSLTVPLVVDADQVHQAAALWEGELSRYPRR